MSRVLCGECIVFENYRKRLIQHCERSELCLHFGWTKIHKNAKKWSILATFLMIFNQCDLFFLLFRSEKLLVVLLVASATVCFLTNLLVFLILTFSTRKDYNKGRKVKLVIRYQLMRNQALAGLVTTSIVIYPLKVRLFVVW